MNAWQKSAAAAASLLIACSFAACSDDTAGTAGQNSGTSSNGFSGVNSGNDQNSRTREGGGEVTDPSCEGDLCSCPDGLVLCDDLCVDVSLNTEHCGECGESCGTGASSCVSGQCQCEESADLCDGECVDLQADLEHCGDCGNECGDNQQCSAGECEPLICDNGVACDGACVDVSSDPENCGGCGDECNGGEVCNSGQCTCEGGSCGTIGVDGRVVGGSCTDANPCDAGSTCEGGEDFPDGQCTTTCQVTADCPDGTACVDIDGAAQCMLTCNNDDACRDDYECSGEQTVDGDDADICLGD